MCWIFWLLLCVTHIETPLSRRFGFYRGIITGLSKISSFLASCCSLRKRSFLFQIYSDRDRASWLAVSVFQSSASFCWIRETSDSYWNLSISFELISFSRICLCHQRLPCYLCYCCNTCSLRYLTGWSVLGEGQGRNLSGRNAHIFFLPAFV